MGTIVPKRCQHIGKDSEKSSGGDQGLRNLLTREIKRAMCIHWLGNILEAAELDIIEVSIQVHTRN